MKQLPTTKFSVAGLLEKMNAALAEESFLAATDPKVTEPWFPAFFGPSIDYRLKCDLYVPVEFGILHPLSLRGERKGRITIEIGRPSQKEDMSYAYEALTLEIASALKLKSGKTIEPRTIEFACYYCDCYPSELTRREKTGDFAVPKERSCELILPSEWFFKSPPKKLVYR